MGTVPYFPAHHNPPDDRNPAGEAHPSLRANFAWTLSGNIVYAGCQWGMLVVLARLGSSEMMGQFAFALAVSAPVMMLANLQLRTLQATDVQGVHPFRDYLGLRLVTSLLAVAAIAAIAAFAGCDVPTMLVVLTVAAGKAVESASDVLFGLFQQRERMDRIARSLIVKGPLSLAALAAGVYATGHVYLGTTAVAAVWAAVLLLHDLPGGRAILGGRREEIRPRFDRARLARLAWIALPLGMSTAVISLNGNIPGYFLTFLQGSTALGVFTAVGYIALGNALVVQALQQTVLPRLAHYHRAGLRRRFRALTCEAAALIAAYGGLVSLIAAVCGGPVLSVLYGSGYATYAELFFWTSLAGTLSFVSGLLRGALTAAGCLRIQNSVSLAATALAVSACGILVPSYGLLGAAWAGLAVAAVQCATFGVFVATCGRRPAIFGAEGGCNDGAV